MLLNHLTYLGLILGLAPVEDVLHHVVAVLVLDQGLDVCVELLQDGGGLLGRAVLQDPLDHPAPVRVGRQVEHLPCERVDDELESARLHGLDTLLDNVVAILVLHTFQNISIEFLKSHL